MTNINLNWHVPDPACFIVMVFIWSVGVRIVMSALRAVKITYDLGWSTKKYRTMFFRSFTGFFPRSGEESRQSEYGHVFILGLLELGFYPVLVFTQAWAAIGAWVALKALAQWEVWAKDRSVFNLFLIGNALNVMISVIFLSRYITK